MRINYAKIIPVVDYTANTGIIQVHLENEKHMTTLRNNAFINTRITDMDKK